MQAGGRRFDPVILHHFLGGQLESETRFKSKSRQLDLELNLVGNYSV